MFIKYFKSEDNGNLSDLSEYRQKKQLEVEDRIMTEKVRSAQPAEKKQPLVCKYATDTGERAFANLPCRGNKILCGKIEGHTSYTAACNPGNCKFFEKKDE